MNRRHEFEKKFSTCVLPGDNFPRMAQAELLFYHFLLFLGLTGFHPDEQKGIEREI